MCNIPVRDRTNRLFVVSIGSITVAVIAVGVRIYVATTQSTFGMDDIMCLAALAANLPLTLLQTITPKLGFGRDTWAVPAENITKVLRVCVETRLQKSKCMTDRDAVCVGVASQLLPM